MEQNIQGNGDLKNEKVTVLKFGLTVQDMRANGKMIKQMAEVYFITRRVMSTMENGEMIKLTVKVYTPMQMERHIMGIGLMTSKMDLVLRLGQMVRSTKGFIKKERSMVKAS